MRLTETPGAAPSTGDEMLRRRTPALRRSRVSKSRCSADGREDESSYTRSSGLRAVGRVDVSLMRLVLVAHRRLSLGKMKMVVSWSRGEWR